MRNAILTLIFFFGIGLFFPSGLLAQSAGGGQADYGMVQCILVAGVTELGGCVSEDEYVAKDGAADPLYDKCIANRQGQLDLCTWTGGTSAYADQGSVIGSVNKGIMAMITNQPASSVTYVADVMQQVNPNQQAYAQGLGFASLTPILGIWKAFRNIAYFVFVLIFAVVGFAIIFRAKINPQTVVNIQLALPRLVITLLLITFSYAIAGLMIDVMYISIFLLIGVLSVTAFDGQTAMLSEIAFGNNFVANVFNFMFAGGDKQFNLGATFDGISVLTTAMLGHEPTDAGLDIGNLIASIGAFGLSLLFTLVLLVVILWKSLQIFFSLAVAYVQILLIIITAPLRLLLNAYPGSNSFVSWLKDLAGQLSVFPVVVFMLFMAMMLMGSNTADGIGFNAKATDQRGFTPPQLNFGQGQGVQVLLGVGVLLYIPQTLEAVKKYFGSGGGGGGGGGGAFAGGLAGGAFGGVLGGMAAPFKFVGKQVGGGLSEAAMGYAGNYISNIPGIRRYSAWRDWNAAKQRAASREDRVKLTRMQASGANLSDYMQERWPKKGKDLSSNPAAGSSNRAAGGGNSDKSDGGRNIDPDDA